MPLVKREYDLPIGDLDQFKPDTVYGYAYITNASKPLYSCRKISKGPDKGKYECVYLKKARKFATIRLSAKQIKFLETPWKRNGNKKKGKLVLRDRS